MPPHTLGPKEKGRVKTRPSSERLLLDGDDIHHAATTVGAELNGARGESEQGVIATTANVVTRVEVGAALAHDDFARLHALAAEALHPEALRIGITTVAGAGCALLMCHDVTPYLPALMPVTLTAVSSWRWP